MKKKSKMVKLVKKVSPGVTKVLVRRSGGLVKKPAVPANAAYRFQPGHPGRVKKTNTLVAQTPNLTKRLKFLLTQPYPQTPSGRKVEGHKQLYADKLVEVLAQMAARGEYQHLNMVWDRVEGKVPIAFHNTGNQAPAITFNLAVAVPPKTKNPPTIEGAQVAQMTVSPQLPTGEQLLRMSQDKAPIPETDDGQG